MYVHDLKSSLIPLVVFYLFLIQSPFSIITRIRVYFNIYFDQIYTPTHKPFGPFDVTSDKQYRLIVDKN